MKATEIEALRNVADEIWALARKLEHQGFREAAEAVKEAADELHHKGRLSSSPPAKR